MEVYTGRTFDDGVGVLLREVVLQCRVGVRFVVARVRRAHQSDLVGTQRRLDQRQQVHH